MNLLDSIKLKNINGLAGDAVIIRGMEYFKQNRVELTSLENNHAHLHVEDSSDTYCIDIDLIGLRSEVTNATINELIYECDCLAYDDWGTCKHIIAAFLYLQKMAIQDKSKSTAAKTPQWQSQLTNALRYRDSTSTSYQKKSRPFIILFSLEESTYYESLSIKAYKIYAKDFPKEIVDQGIFKATKEELVTYMLQEKPSNYSTVKSKISQSACLNASHLMTTLINHRFDSYYSPNFNELLTTFDELNTPLFLGTTDDPFKTLLTVHSTPLRVNVDLSLNDSKQLVLSSKVHIDDADLPKNPEIKIIYLSNEYWSLIGNHLAQLPTDIARHTLESMLKLPEMTIPESDRSFFINNYLPSLLNDFHVTGNLIVWHDKKDENPKREIHLFEEEKKLFAQLHFNYDGSSISASDTSGLERLVSQVESDDEKIHLANVVTNPIWEETAVREVSNARYGLKRSVAKDTVGVYELRAKVDPIDFLLKKAPKLLEDGFTIFGEESLKNAKVNRNKPTLSMSVSSGIDWFDIQALVNFGDIQVKLPEIRKAVRAKQSFMKLEDGSIGEIPEEWIAKYKHLFQLGDQSDDESIRLSNHHLTLIDQLMDEVDDSHVDQAYRDRLAQLKSFEKIEDIPLSPLFEGELRPYQKAGFDWLHFLHQYKFGGCLADDMGLGKTVQVLSFLQSIRSVSGKKYPPCLVVLPRSILVNWERESQQFTPNLKSFIQFGPSRNKNCDEFANYDLILTTFGTMRQDVEFLKDYMFHYVILDEAQAIKNPAAQVSKAVRLLKSHHRLAITGTPIENNTFELWSLFAFLNPGLLGSGDYFKNNFGNPIERQQDEDAANLLKQMVYPFILRRTKAVVASDLPPRTDKVLMTSMEPAQRKFYDKTRDKYRAELMGLIEKEGMNKARFKVLEGLLRLRQICNHPKLVNNKFKGDSAKLNLLLDTMENLANEGHKALIFSQFVQMLTIVRKELDKRKISYAYLDGQTRKRQAEVDSFQENPDLTFFLISLKAGGVGLNLTAADYVIHIDPWWNPAVEMQATDRAHRIGQERPVFVYKLITKDSVEEKILQLQEQKRKLVEQLITTEGSMSKQLSSDDIQVLFS